MLIPPQKIFSYRIFLSLPSENDACTGDSGGALFMVRPGSETVHKYLSVYELTGITSFGKECGQIGYPGMS